MDAEASNLPYDPQNTKFGPSNVITTSAGKSVTIDIELRTTNKNLRANMWFSDIANKFKATFSGEQLTANFAKGSLPGRYQMTVTPKLANVNVVEFTIEGILVFSSNVQLVVQPADINLIKLSSNSQTIPDHSVDQDFIVSFIAYDQFENVIKLDSNSPINSLFISSSNSSHIPHTKEFTT